MVGEIHLANIFFTDASAAKIRPILLLKHNSFNDLLYLPLTSNPDATGVHIDNGNLQDGFLPKLSVVVYEKPGVIASNLLVKKIGTLNKDVFDKILQELILFLQK